ncbi:MAG: hypothetical protein WEA09_02150 [Gemmatimonadota bacterium]
MHRIFRDAELEEWEVVTNVTSMGSPTTSRLMFRSLSHPEHPPRSLDLPDPPVGAALRLKTASREELLEFLQAAF